MVFARGRSWAPASLRSPGFESRDRFGTEGQQGKQWGSRGNHGYGTSALGAEDDVGRRRRNALGRWTGVHLIAPCDEAGRLAGGVDTADLGRRRQQSPETEHHGGDDRDEC